MKVPYNVFSDSLEFLTHVYRHMYIICIVLISFHYITYIIYAYDFANNKYK